MEEKMDFLFEIECQIGLLCGTITALDILTTDLQESLTLLRPADNSPPVRFYDDRCVAIVTVLKELPRIRDALDNAVAGLSRERRQLAAQMDGGE